MLLPVARRPLLIVTLERLTVVEAVITEHRTAGLKLVAVPNQNVPVVMTDLVPEMAQQRSIWLTHGNPTSFALSIFRLLECDRNLAFVVAGEDLRTSARRWIGEEFKGQPVNRIFYDRRKWQNPPQQTVEQPMFSEFNLLPRRKGRLIGQVGNDTVMPARNTERVIRAGRDQPVTPVVFRVPTQEALLIGCRERRPPTVAGRLQRGQRRVFRQIRQSVTTSASPSFIRK